MLVEGGLNSLSPPQEKSAWIKFLEHLFAPLELLLITAGMAEALHVWNLHDATAAGDALCSVLQEFYHWPPIAFTPLNQSIWCSL
jgi:hypothetical protein